jgi:hypothetical protein
MEKQVELTIFTNPDQMLGGDLFPVDIQHLPSDFILQELDIYTVALLII